MEGRINKAFDAAKRYADGFVCEGTIGECIRWKFSKTKELIECDIGHDMYTIFIAEVLSNQTFKVPEVLEDFIIETNDTVPDNHIFLILGDEIFTGCFGTGYFVAKAYKNSSRVQVECSPVNMNMRLDSRFIEVYK